MRGHVYKRGNGWTVVFDEGRTPEGRRVQRSRGGFASRREAQAFLTTTLARLGDGSYATPSRTTLGQFLESEWLPAIEGTIRPLSFVQYRSIVRGRIVPRIGQRRLQSVTGADLNALYRELDEAGLSVATRRLTHAVLSRAFTDAIKWGQLVRNPAASADPPAAVRSRATAWTPGELHRFLDHVAEDRLFGLWRLAAMSGLRRGELAGLTWRGLDLEGGTLTVSQQLVPTRGGCTFGPPKSSRGLRTIALDEGTVDALRQHREAQLRERDAAGEAYDDHDLVFADELGAPIPPQRLTDRFATVRKAAKIASGSLHVLRHTHATHLLAAGVPVHVVAARLGDTPATVMSVYAHLLPTSDADAASRVAALVASAR